MRERHLAIDTEEFLLYDVFEGAPVLANLVEDVMALAVLQIEAVHLRVACHVLPGFSAVGRLLRSGSDSLRDGLGLLPAIRGEAAAAKGLGRVLPGLPQYHTSVTEMLVRLRPPAAFQQRRPVRRCADTVAIAQR